MNLCQPPVALGQQAFVSSATQKHPLGTRGYDKYGRKFRYVQAGAAALVVGNVLQAPAEVTTHQTCAVTATAAGATAMTITLGATNAVVANQYAEGWAVIDTTPGLGYAYPIISHPAAAASAACVLTLAQDAPIQVALTTSSKVTLVSNPYKSVIQCPVTTLTGAPVGVAVYPIALTEYGWIQTGGPASVLTAGTPAVGSIVVVPATAAGSVVVSALQTTGTTPVMGVMMAVGKDGTCCPVYLTLD